MCVCVFTHKYTHSYTPSHTRAHSRHQHSHEVSLTYSHTHTHTHAHTHTNTQTHICTRTHIHTHSHTHINTHTPAALAKVRGTTSHPHVCLDDTFMFYCHVLARRYSGTAASTSVALQPAQLRVTAAAAGAAAEALGRAQVRRLVLCVHGYVFMCM